MLPGSPVKNRTSFTLILTLILLLPWFTLSAEARGEGVGDCVKNDTTMLPQANVDESPEVVAGVQRVFNEACTPFTGDDSNVPKIFDVVREIGKDAKIGCGGLDPDELFIWGCEAVGAVCNMTGIADGTGRRAVEVVEVNTIEGSEELQEIGCREPGTAVTEDGEPVVITVTQEDFARMPVEPLIPNAGPPNGWVPVNMVNVLYVEPEAQTLDVELLDTPVQVRATPISYHWDLGDGNTITTSKPGKPYPSEEVASEYTYEGWYDITLTTTFRGEFSVDGGEWQPIEGTIEVASDPVEIFAKSFESRLVDGDVPPDEEEDPWVPERSPETEGPQDPEARHREI